MKFSERLKQFEGAVPGIQVADIVPYPCCHHCFYLNWETGDEKEGDDYHGIYVCDLHREITFSDYNPKRLMLPYHVVCDDYLQKLHKEE